jgi:hypothetical protein
MNEVTGQDRYGMHVDLTVRSKDAWMGDLGEVIVRLRKLPGGNTWISQRPISEKMFTAVCGFNPAKFPVMSGSPEAWIERAGDGLPMVGLSRSSCVEFCRSLSRMTSHKLRLPTVNEWISAIDKREGLGLEIVKEIPEWTMGIVAEGTTTFGILCSDRPETMSAVHINSMPTAGFRIAMGKRIKRKDKKNGNID